MSEEAEVAQILSRPSCPALDEILGKPFKVLDKGFVRVIDYMGDDAAITQAARVSYGKGTKKLSEDDGLIRYLLRHTHTTPFEQCEIKFHVRVPMDCWRQWIRHRMSNTNEYSTRYSEAIDDKQETNPRKWRLQSGTNKQGSSGFVDSYPEKSALSIALDGSPGDHLSRKESQFHCQAKALYEERLAFGVAKEQARKDLPLSTYTEAYWKCDLHNLLHFLSLRMDAHAQEEIRAYANVIGDIVVKWVPLAWAAFNDYNFRRDALLLSARDKVVIAAMIGAKNVVENNQDSLPNFAQEDSENDARDCVLKVATSFGWMEKRDDGTLKDNRERVEFEKKIAQLGMAAPWTKGLSK